MALGSNDLSTLPLIVPDVLSTLQPIRPNTLAQSLDMYSQSPLLASACLQKLSALPDRQTASQLWTDAPASPQAMTSLHWESIQTSVPAHTNESTIGELQEALQSQQHHRQTMLAVVHPKASKPKGAGPGHTLPFPLDRPGWCLLKRPFATPNNEHSRMPPVNVDDKDCDTWADYPNIVHGSFFQRLSGNEVRGIVGEKRLRCVCFSFGMSSHFPFWKANHRSLLCSSLFQWTQD